MKRFSLILVALLLAGTGAVAWAEPLVFISPLRVELKPQDEVAVLTVTNKSDRVKYYQAVLSDQIMRPDATTQEVDDFPYSAKAMLRFMPRKFDLQPGQRRVIRVMARRPANLADGDYHTHLMFEEDIAAREAAARREVSATVPEGSVKFQVEAVYSVAIPLVVQNGSVSSSMVMGNATYSPTAANGKPGLVVQFTRRGNAEASGYVTATLADGSPAISKRLLRLYREVDDYSVVFPLAPSVKSGSTVTVRLANSFTPEAIVQGQANVVIP